MTTPPRAPAQTTPRRQPRKQHIGNTLPRDTTPQLATNMVFSWPHAFTLVGLTSASYAFVLLLLRSGQDMNTAVIVALTLIAGIAILVLPAAGGSVLRRISSAIVAALSHGGQR